MATIKQGIDIIVVSGISSDGLRIRKQFSKKRQGKFYKDLANDLYKRLIFDSTEFESSFGAKHINFKKLRLRELSERYVNEHLIHTRAAGNKSYIKIFNDKYGDLIVSRISIGLVRPWIHTLLDAGAYSPYTVKKIVRYLIRVLNWSVETELIPYNPLAKLIDLNLKKQFARLCKRREVSMPETDFMNMCAGIDNVRTRNCALVAWHTGMRGGEICNLEWKSIHGDYITLLHEDAKECKPKTIMLNEHVVGILQGIQAEQLSIGHESGRVFPELKVYVLSNSWRYYANKAGHPEWRFHDIRHAFEQRMRRKGVHQRVIDAQLGHRSIRSMADVYDTVDLNDMNAIK